MSEPTITCPHFKPAPDGRCAHVLPNGSCALPDELGCVEWERQAWSASIAHTAPPSAPSTVPEREPPASRPLEPIAATTLLGLTRADLAKFKSLRVEFCLRGEHFDELWLVGSYTGKPRRELTPEHALMLLSVLAAFRGSWVTAFEPDSSTSAQHPENT